MRNLLFTLVFILGGQYFTSAQDDDSFSSGRESNKSTPRDTTKKPTPTLAPVPVGPHWKICGHFGFYGSYGIAYVPGSMTVPPSEQESYVNSTYTYSRVSTTTPPGQVYSGGITYLPQSDGPVFITFDLGYSAYSYGGTATDAFYAENSSGSFVFQGNQSFNYNYQLNMFDVTMRVLGSFVQWRSGRVSAGFALKAGYAVSQSNSGYVPTLPYGVTVTPNNAYSTNVDFVSGLIQFDHNMTDQGLVCVGVYYGLSLVGASINSIATAGVQLSLQF